MERALAKILIFLMIILIGLCLLSCNTTKKTSGYRAVYGKTYKKMKTCAPYE